MNQQVDRIARSIQWTNRVIQTRCPQCDAEPGFACWTDATGRAEVFHANRLMATDFGDR